MNLLSCLDQDRSPPNLVEVTGQGAKPEDCCGVCIIDRVKQVELQQVGRKIDTQVDVANQQISLGFGQARSLDHKLDGGRALFPRIMRQKRHAQNTNFVSFWHRLSANRARPKQRKLVVPMAVIYRP